MQLPLLAARLLNEPVLVSPTYAHAAFAMFAGRLGFAGMQAPRADADAEPETPSPGMRSAYHPRLDSLGILTVPVAGPLMNRGTFMDADCGAQSYTNLTNGLVAGVENPNVRGILLDLDTPGGEAGGMFSFGETIRDIAKAKPVWGVANSLAASAGYAIGCSCDRLYASRDAFVGSIGVVVQHVDIKEAAEKAGIAVTYLFKGAHKVDGHMFGGLTESARAEFEKRISAIYDEFVEFVAEGRGMTEKAVRQTEARIYLANEAKELGLIDGVKSYEQTRQEFAAFLDQNASPQTNEPLRITFNE